MLSTANVTMTSVSAAVAYHSLHGLRRSIDCRIVRAAGRNCKLIDWLDLSRINDRRRAPRSDRELAAAHGHNNGAGPNSSRTSGSDPVPHLTSGNLISGSWGPGRQSMIIAQWQPRRSARSTGRRQTVIDAGCCCCCCTPLTSWCPLFPLHYESRPYH